MSFANRYQRPKTDVHPLVTPTEAYVRVMAAIRTLRASPPVKPMGMRSNWPSEFEFHSNAIKWAVFAGEHLDLGRKKKGRQSVGRKLYRRLKSKDFDDINLEQPKAEDTPPPRPRDPTRKQISDALLAGAWFSALQRLPENADQAIDRLEEYRRGDRANAFVDDQKLLDWLAHGWSVAAIAQHGGTFKNEREVEIRINVVAHWLCQIANGTAELVDLAERRRDRERAERERRAAIDAASRERAGTEADLLHRAG